MRLPPDATAGEIGEELRRTLNTTGTARRDESREPARRDRFPRRQHKHKRTVAARQPHESSDEHLSRSDRREIARAKQAGTTVRRLLGKVAQHALNHRIVARALNEGQLVVFDRHLGYREQHAYILATVFDAALARLR